MGLQYSPRSTGSGNATVPNDAPILPPQAFVDNISAFLLPANGSVLYEIDLTNKGITFLNGNLLTAILATVSENSLDAPSLDLTGNALSGSNVADICAAVVVQGFLVNNTLRFSGGTNGTPTGGVINADIWQIATGGDGHFGGYVEFNVHGVKVTAADGNLDAAGNALTVSEVNALMAFLVANYSTLSGAIIDVSGGTNAAPTGQGITDKNTLIANGLTVTTN